MLCSIELYSIELVIISSTVYVSKEVRTLERYQFDEPRSQHSNKVNAALFQIKLGDWASRDSMGDFTFCLRLSPSLFAEPKL